MFLSMRLGLKPGSQPVSSGAFGHLLRMSDTRNSPFHSENYASSYSDRTVFNGGLRGSEGKKGGDIPSFVAQVLVGVYMSRLPWTNRRCSR